MALTHWGRHKMAANFADDMFKCIFLNENVWIWIIISLKFVPKGPINNIPIRRQANVWTNDDFVCWRIYAALGLNELTHWQNGRHFADDTFKHIFLNKNVCISIEISLKFVPKGPMNNMPALVQIMARRRTGDKPLSEPLMTQFNDAYMRHPASMS